MQQLSDQRAGVDPVDVLSNGAERAGQAEPPGDDRGDLDRGGGDQPHPLPLVEVELGQGSRARPDPVGHPLVEDLLAQQLQLLHGVPGDEGERRGSCVGHVLGVLDADEPEVGLLPGRSQDVAGGEELPVVQATGQVEDRGALHHGVVDVEERRGGRVGLHREGALDLGDRCGGLARELRAALQVAGRTGRLAARRRGRHPSSLGDRRPRSGLVGVCETRPMESNVAELLSRAASLEPGKTALSEAESGRSITWSELDELVQRVVQGLSDAGLVAGYRVMVATGNSIEFVAAYLGVLRAGMVAVPVNPRSATGELMRMIADSGARMVVADTSTVGSVRQAVAGLNDAMAAIGTEPATRPRVVTVGTTLEPGERGWDQLVARAGRPTPVRVDPETLAVLLYTSGTSGRPRAAMLSHRALLANIDQVAQVDPAMITGRDVVLGVLPLFHVYGLNAVLGQVVRQQARMVLVDGFDPEGSLDIIEDEAISVVPVAPPVVAYWMGVPGLEDRLGPVRLVLSGSAPLDPELTAAFTARTSIDIHQGYGLTEAAPVVTSTLCSAAPSPRSVGAALPGIEITLVDDAGRPPHPEDEGEIHVRGANLFSGYWPDGTDGPDAEGWWATGDVGYLDPSGDLYLVDRIKEMVIVSGFNVYPSEVEDVLTELPEVAEAAVIGVDDELSGEAVVAYVRPTTAGSSDALVDLVLAHCGQRLARFKQPTVIHVVEELPYTVTGKVQKGRLRATERRRSLGLLE